MKRKGTGWTMEDLQRLKEEGKIVGFTQPKQEEPPKKKKSKFNNQTLEWNGEKFDSKREYQRYRDLLLLLKAGKIGLLTRQVEYELNNGGTHSVKYVADFVYTDIQTGEKIVEDSKGFRTREYKKKRRLMWKIHQIKILET